jgi:hypothetical protein
MIILRKLHHELVTDEQKTIVQAQEFVEPLFQIDLEQAKIFFKRTN